VLEVRPVFLKSISRIEEFLFLEFVAVILDAVIERECGTSTAGRIFELFGNLLRHLLREGSRIVWTFRPGLSPVQRGSLTCAVSRLRGFVKGATDRSRRRVQVGGDIEGLTCGKQVGVCVADGALTISLGGALSIGGLSIGGVVSP
jgi:hypothetical protein